MNFALYLFTTNPELASEALAAGVAGIIIDWEWRGKARRQAGADTQVNRNTPEDLARVRRAVEGPVLVRINGFCESTCAEVEVAIQRGANEILLPMVRAVEEVQKTLDYVAGRCKLGILVETMEAVTIAGDLGKLPLSRVYVGLNDLSIARQSRNLFEAMADGTVDRIRHCFPMPFGIAGLTLPERGTPIPCRLIMSELARLECSFSFLRRSFWADIRGRNFRCEIPRILDSIIAAHRRDPQATAQDRAEFVRKLAVLVRGPDRAGPASPEQRLP